MDYLEGRFRRGCVYIVVFPLCHLTQIKNINTVAIVASLRTCVTIIRHIGVVVSVTLFVLIAERNLHLGKLYVIVVWLAGMLGMLVHVPLIGVVEFPFYHILLNSIAN